MAKTSKKTKKTTKNPSAKERRIATKTEHKLPNFIRLARCAAEALWSSRKVFLGIILLYGFLNLLLVQGFAAGTDVSSLKRELNNIFTGQFGAIASGLSIFALLVGSAGSGSSDTAGAYQFFLTIITSLALIWALRQVSAGQGFRVRDAFYSGMYPLVPFILVLLLVGVQLVPMLIGSSIYSIVMTNGIAVYAIEKILWALGFGLLTLLSLYWLSASLFALYIVTLPEMTPIKAWRSAKQLVRGRRWLVLRKIVALPLLLLIIAALIMVPIIIWLAPLAQWVFFVLTMFGLAATHAYMYTLYRELLNE